MLFNALCSRAAARTILVQQLQVRPHLALRRLAARDGVARARRSAPQSHRDAERQA